MRYTFRPLSAWTEKPTDPLYRRSRYQFRAGWQSTLDLLERELGYLDARNVVIEADFAEGDIRIDGMPRANARQPTHPGVRVAFDSKHGPLVYATDSSEFWQHNVRSIALGLEALRAVDRYGITHRAEQYTGWKAITTGPTAMPATRQMTVEDAARYLLSAIGDPLTPTPNAVITVPATRLQVYRQAVRGLHPDAGGDPDLFDRVQEAKRVLDEHNRAGQ